MPKTTIDWKEEAEIINCYADCEIEPTKEGVMDYLEMISSINGEGHYYSNEKRILKETGLLED